MKLKKFNLKIEPKIEDEKETKVIGFKSVQSGTGSTTFATHVAMYMAKKLKKRVLYIDLDYENPNKYLRDKHTVNPIGRINDSNINILDAISETKEPLLKYIGLPPTKNFTELLPQEVTQDFIRIRQRSYNKIISDAQSKWDYIILDIPSSLMAVETMMTLNLCDKVYILFDVNDTNKYISDMSILRQIEMEHTLNDVIFVSKLNEIAFNFKDINPDMNVVTSIRWSKELDLLLLSGKIDGNLEDYNGDWQEYGYSMSVIKIAKEVCNYD